MPSGFIRRGVGGFYYVESEDGGIFECKARGIFRKEGVTPLPGDNVIFRITDQISKEGIITSIKERKSVLVRPQVANVDQVVAVFAVRSPDPDLLLLDKILIVAAKKDLDVAICINKADLDNANGDVRSDFKRQYSLYSPRLIYTSTVNMSGFDLLKERLKGKNSVFAGPSGVGKSTILNTLTGRKDMETGELSAKTDRGKHTTRHAELIRLADGGIVVDTPGFSAFDIDRIDCGDLHGYYPEFEELSQGCRFKGCRHLSEPGCRVSEAVENGSVSRERYDRYVRLYNVLKSSKVYT